MTVGSWIFVRSAKLAPAQSQDVQVERDLETKMGDGTILLGDRWFSPDRVADGPVVLIRTPYGRRQFGLFGRVFAERGFQTYIQSVRGTFGSGGPFEPFRNERRDGLDTIEWISRQPWFTGSLVTFGPSYLGLTQWAVAAKAPDFVKVMAMQVTAADVRNTVIYPGGSFTLESGAAWMQQMEFQERGLLRFAWSMARFATRVKRVYSTTPLSDADRVGFGRHVDYYQQWLDHDQPDDGYWAEIDYTDDVVAVPPTSHVAGWYDLFLPGQIKDFIRLDRAGRPSRLTVGPWTHTSRHLAMEGVRDALDAFSGTSAPGADWPGSAPVRLFMMGRGTWVDSPSWPPPSSPQRWYLHGGRRFSTDEPTAGPSRPDRYLYDPADPTPSVGGTSLDPFRSGPKNQRRREQRCDVLSYSSDVLESDLTIAGHVRAFVSVRSTRRFFDVFVRLCDVDERGRSFNICDGILRCSPDNVELDSDGVVGVMVDLWPTAQTFLAGHRIRVQISSAAHPLFARNPGSGERLGSAHHLYPSDQEVFHDAAHPSYLELPVSTI